MESTTGTRPAVRAIAAPSDWLLMAVLVAGHAVKHLYNGGFFILLPAIQTGFGLSNTALGTLSTARNVTSGLTNLPAGFLADRYSRHWGAILGVAMAVVGIFTFVLGSVNSFMLLLIAAAVVGGAISFWHPSAIAALSQRFPQRRGFAIALHGTGGSIGEAISPLLVGTLLGLIAWQSVLRLGLAPALITAAVVWVLMRNLQGQTTSELTFERYLRAVQRLVSNPAVLTVLVVTGCFSMVQGALWTFLPVYLRIDLGYSDLQMGAFVSAAQVAGIMSQPILGHLSDRLGRKTVLAPSLLLLALGVLAVGLAPPGWPLAVSVTLMGAFQFPLMSLFLATAMDEEGEEVQATTVSLVFGIGTIFASLSPTIAGFLADAFAVRVVFFYCAAFGVLGAIVLLARGRARRS